MVAKSFQIGDEHGHLDDIAHTQSGSTTIALAFSRPTRLILHISGSHRSVGTEFAEVGDRFKSRPDRRDLIASVTLRFDNLFLHPPASERLGKGT